jgi:hypothetical protein
MLNKIAHIKKDLNLHRGQFLFKEGDHNNDIYIIRSGQYMISKNLYISKRSENFEKEMLVNDTSVVNRYQNNFKAL